jgi:DNA-3-methyladenine glycosylase II
MNAALKHLAEQDSVMKDLAGKFPNVSVAGNYMESAGALFVDLVRSIAGQQLSVKAASTIWGRVETLLGGSVTVAGVLSVPQEALRAAGLSTPKTKYIKGIAEAVTDGTLCLDQFHEMQDEAVIEQLTRVKGIGRWTAEMFLIFALARPDVFSFGDIGLRNAMTKLYGEMSRETQEAIVAKWSPYRSFACLLLWESLDNTP